MLNLKSIALSAMAIIGTTGVASAVTPSFVGDRTDFRDETIYFLMTSRFFDGDSSNNTQCWDNRQANAGDPAWRGDFKGLIEKLDYIKALGFTAVWITPVVENASGYDYHGYHASNFSKVDKRLTSSDADLQRLINEAHSRGMKVIIDIVLNHTGNFGEENLCKLFTRDWSAPQSDLNACMKPFTAKDGGKLPDNYLSLPGGQQYQARLSQMKNVDGKNHDNRNFWHHAGHFNWDDPTRWYGQIAGDCVDLNTENPAVTNYLVDCYSKFIEMGCDGFRIDTSGHISRLTFNKAFIPQFHEAAEKYKAKRGGTPFFIFGEVCARERNVVYRNHQNLSPFFYTWKEEKDYAWNTDPNSWDNIVVMEGEKGNHTNITSVDQSAEDYNGESNMPNSNNHALNGNKYVAPDHSKHSGFNVIDFTMHWNFRTAREAFSIKSGDKLYNDATYNVTYVDSHDYAPDGAPEGERFSQPTDVWAENLNLLFSFRGIPTLYYGSEIEFRKGKPIDKGPTIPLRESGRAYFGGYIKGNVNVQDFAQYSNATGNIAATLAHPLAKHVQRLNRLRAAIPALRKGAYSCDGCSGELSFKRRYTDAKTDSYVLVTISGNSTFTGVENGRYVDAITGDVQNVTNGTLTATCSGKGNMRVYVLDTALTPAPGKVGEDGKYLNGGSAPAASSLSYDGTEEELSSNNGDHVDRPSTDEPEQVVTPALLPGEKAVFFENTKKWTGGINCYSWDQTGGNLVKFCGDWPGTPAKYLGNNIWKYTYTTSSEVPTTAGVIFNGSGGQTKDMIFVNGGYYDADGYVKTITPTSAVNSITNNFKIVAGKGSITVVADQQGVLNLYLPDGRAVELQLQEGYNTFDLPSGIYIANGKKYIL